GRVDAVKLEGGAEVVPAARAVATAGVPVLGHIGLTPQRANALGGFRVQGTTLEKAQRLVSDALALQDAGCFGIVLEAMPSAVAARITSLLSIPTIGIGAGPACSGQVLVQLDLLGVYDRFTPKFCKQYANLGDTITAAIGKYAEEVRAAAFPAEGEHTYRMAKGEEERFKEWCLATDVSQQSGI
ncbi:hypothetical protein HK405_013496, partial [Cladochytrium tenue]